MRGRGEQSRFWWVVPLVYIVFLLLPIYWLITMSLKPNNEIVSSLTLYPHELTFHNYYTIFTEAAWYSGYINSIIYVVMNTVISIASDGDPGSTLQALRSVWLTSGPSSPWKCGWSASAP